MDGIILINKEKKYTSHDVVAKVKKILKVKVGHTGTLDPNATGILPLLLGNATKISKYLINHNKEYIAELKLGVKTDTADGEGKVIAEKQVNLEEIFENINESIQQILNSFVGKTLQKPPMYSAIKVNGKKLYEYARKNEKVEVKSRQIEIYKMELIKLDLKEGKWFDNSDIDKEIIPVVISNKLGDTYKINSVFSTNVFLDENMTVKEELTFKVIGILKNKTYVYTGGANHSDCSIADLFIKTTPNDEIVIMPNIFEKMPLYWANNGMIIKTNDYIETYKSIKEKGIGKISSLEDISKNNINNIFIYNEQKIYEFIIVFVFIIMSIGGYNTLANLEYKRLLTIYYITGITWKKGIALLTIRNFIIIVIPTIISSIFSNKIVTYLRTLYTYNEKNVYITVFIYIGIFILTTAVTVIGLRDKKPIEVLREVD